MTHFFIATEDQLSVEVAHRLISTFTKITIKDRTVLWPKNNLGGNGQLKANLKKYFDLAKKYPVLLITDLDTANCAPSLLNSWKNSVNIEMPANMLLRIAVREIESWLLADNIAASKLLATNKIPHDPDQEPDPKRKLIELAKKAPRAIQSDLVAERSARATQGIGYNSRLTNFIRTSWCPMRARTKSDSLERCCRRIENLKVKS